MIATWPGKICRLQPYLEVASAGAVHVVNEDENIALVLLEPGADSVDLEYLAVLLKELKGVWELTLWFG